MLPAPGPPRHPWTTEQSTVHRIASVNLQRSTVYVVDRLREYAHKMVDFIADYYKMIESFPVLSQVEPGYLKELLPDLAPSKPENLEDVFDDIRQKIMPGITHRLGS
uniref:Uncharacterized protein n=1 Tax=Ananas comosus var. bracteatus TaxID=296719 RepID=A0A6V7P1D8_ANACO|nr:unnamed protein product [Ananas comosus var. bracteatus]